MVDKVKKWLNEDAPLTIKKRIGYSFLFPVIFVITMLGLTILNAIIALIFGGIANNLAITYPNSTLAQHLENFFDFMFWMGGTAGGYVIPITNLLVDIIPVCILGLAIITLWITKSWRKPIIIGLLLVPDIIIYFIVLAVHS